MRAAVRTKAHAILAELEQLRLENYELRYQVQELTDLNEHPRSKASLLAANTRLRKELSKWKNTAQLRGESRDLWKRRCKDAEWACGMRDRKKSR
jgi:hypothetical protein